MLDQRGELPLLPFGNPIGFVPASRGGVYIKFCLMIMFSLRLLAEQQLPNRFKGGFAILDGLPDQLHHLC